jgi:steroid 5-alpha reductase family enzyme
MILVVSFLLAAALQSALWVLACRRRNAGWVDLGWSSGMAMAAITLGLAGPSHPRTWMVALLLFAWAFRLALHIYRDRLAGNRPEDSRYQALRAHWGAAADRNFLVFFLGQAALVPLFLLPPLLAASNPAPFPNWQDALGLLVIFAAVMGESISDHQLALFRANPANRGQVCRRGW